MVYGAHIYNVGKMRATMRDTAGLANLPPLATVRPDTPLPIKSVALYIGVTPQSLERWRMEHRGPTYIRLGDGPRAPIRYLAGDVQEWITQRRVTPTAGRAACTDRHTPTEHHMIG